MTSENKVEISIFNKTFWDLFVQKLMRNWVSVKYQWLVFLYIPVIWGMFNINVKTGAPWISSELGLSFLGGAFITLATSRIVARTKLTENNGDLDTDK